MIYDRLAPVDPVRQGDIFASLPRVRVPLSVIPVIDDTNAAIPTGWDKLAQEGHEVVACLPLAPVRAIVITQDCDAARNEEISLCEIRPFEELEPNIGAHTVKARVGVITKNARKNYKWFYLPPDPDFGLDKRLAVDFRCTMRLSREELEAHLHLRIGRLNNVAYDHFRERLAHFFRRYAYNEWYPLDSEEMDLYSSTCPEPVQRYPWQRPQ